MGLDEAPSPPASGRSPDPRVSETVDLGLGFSFRFYSWSPDRSIASNAERFADAPDVERAGLILTCPHGDGGITFTLEGHPTFGDPERGWKVESWDPLTLSPSIHRLECGCHGFIREGRWVPA